MEWHSVKNKTSTGSNCNGRQQAGLGGAYDRRAPPSSSRMLGSHYEPAKFERSRNPSSSSNIKIFYPNCKREISDSLYRQHNNSMLYQHARGSMQTSVKHSKPNMDLSTHKQYRNQRPISGRQVEPASRCPFALKQQIRMGNKPKPIQLFELSVGTAYLRSICLPHNQKMSKIQQPLLGTKHTRCERIASDGLGNRKQFCERTSQINGQNIRHYTNTTSRSNNNCPDVARKNLFPPSSINVCKTTDKVTKSEIFLHSERVGNAGAFKKSKMGVVRLENFWENQLKSLNWNDDCIARYPAFLAASTLNQYNIYIQLFLEFCNKKSSNFPPSENDMLPFITEFLFEQAKTSERPESKLKTAVSALKHLCASININIRIEIVDNFVKALIKSETTKPKGRTPIIPLQEITCLFKSWQNNENLPIEKLRQKAITLFVIGGMCRCSDISPKVGFFRDQINFNNDGSMTVQLFGIKNDSSKTGFEIRISGSKDKTIDPVVCLKHYFLRTESCLFGHVKKPVFISLKSPYQGLTAATVTNILSTTLTHAGIKDKYSVRSFRASAITAAVIGGADAQSVRVQARIKTQSVFFDNYKYPITHDSMTDQVFKGEFPS